MSDSGRSIGKMKANCSTAPPGTCPVCGDTGRFEHGVLVVCEHYGKMFTEREQAQKVNRSYGRRKKTTS